MRIDYPYLHRVVSSLGGKMLLKQVIKHTDADFEETTRTNEFEVLGHVQIDSPNEINADDFDWSKQFCKVYFKYNTRANIPKIVLTEQVEWFGHFRGEWFRLISIDQHQEYGFVMAHAERWENVT